MWSKHSRVRHNSLALSTSDNLSLIEYDLLTSILSVIAKNALQQEESEEFSGDFQDPINIHIENEGDACAC